MDAEVLRCILCNAPPYQINNYTVPMNRCVMYEIACHGLLFKISISYEELAQSGFSLASQVQARFNDACNAAWPTTRTEIPKIQVTEAPVVLRKPQRKIDLE